MDKVWSRFLEQNSISVNAFIVADSLARECGLGSRVLLSSTETRGAKRFPSTQLGAQIFSERLICVFKEGNSLIVFLRLELTWSLLGAALRSANSPPHSSSSRVTSFANISFLRSSTSSAATAARTFLSARRCTGDYGVRTGAERDGAAAIVRFRHFARFVRLLLREPTVRHASHTAALSIALRFSEFSPKCLKIPVAYLQKRIF